jgi:hypothetical protein
VNIRPIRAFDVGSLVQLATPEQVTALGDNEARPIRLPIRVSALSGATVETDQGNIKLDRHLVDQLVAYRGMDITISWKVTFF